MYPSLAKQPVHSRKQTMKTIQRILSSLRCIVSKVEIHVTSGFNRKRDIVNPGTSFHFVFCISRESKPAAAHSRPEVFCTSRDRQDVSIIFGTRTARRLVSRRATKFGLSRVSPCFSRVVLYIYKIVVLGLHLQILVPHAYLSWSTVDNSFHRNDPLNPRNFMFSISSHLEIENFIKIKSTFNDFMHNTWI